MKKQLILSIIFVSLFFVHLSSIALAEDCTASIASDVYNIVVPCSGINYNVNFTACGYNNISENYFAMFTVSTENPAVETFQLITNQTKTLANGALFRLNSVLCSANYTDHPSTATFSITPALSSCYDTDGGKALNIKGTVTQGSASSTDCCAVNLYNPNCVTSSFFLSERYCDTSGNLNTEVYKCPDGYYCKEGFCANEKYCYDSDGGSNYYVKGYVDSSAAPGQAWDVCINSTLLLEYQCNPSMEGYGLGTNFKCPYGCSDGACSSGTGKCSNHAQCSQACDNLSIAFHWSGTGSNFKSWNGTCSLNVYGCMTGKCCLGQCNYRTTGDCFCARTNTVDIYGSVCPSGQTCGSDCYCHPIEGKPDFTIEKINYYLDYNANPKKLYYQVLIKNIGNVSSNLESNIQIPQLSSYHDNRCTFLNAGESCTETGYGYNGVGGEIPDGYYDIIATVDPRNLVVELNEDNNNLQIKAIVNRTEIKCSNHAQCSQACDNLGINSKWMGSGTSRRFWEGACPLNVYGCMTGDCCLGQCYYRTTGDCFCARTNTVDIYGSVCPEGSKCGDDCFCHPTNVEDYKFSIKTDKYSYSPGENVRITAIISGNSNYNDAVITTFVTDSQGRQYDVKMNPVGTSSSTCTATATGTTCSISTEYIFVGSYNIPSDSPIGRYKVISTALSKGNRKNADTSFEVLKQYNNYVDVSIVPIEQYAIIGDNVKYDVTVTDKHIVKLCPDSTNESTCGEQIYNYLIDVDGLPYHTVFPTVVSVHASGSKTFELKIFPSTAKTEEGITTAVQTTVATAAQTTTAERTVSITGKPIATESKTETVSIQEAIFKFSVKATLREDSTVSNSAIGILHVKFVQIPEPPPFPETEKINMVLKRGWNLVSVPGKGLGFTQGTCSADQKPVAFVYLREQRHVSLEEALNIMEKDKLLEYLSTHSFWIYSYEECNIGFRFNSYSTYSGLSLVQGWNLLGITKDMIGETLNNIKGTCNFEKIYSWDSDSQKWVEKSENDLIEKMGYGILVKTTEACNLKTNLIQPPPFPGG